MKFSDKAQLCWIFWCGLIYLRIHRIFPEASVQEGSMKFRNHRCGLWLPKKLFVFQVAVYLSKKSGVAIRLRTAKVNFILVFFENINQIQNFLRTIMFLKNAVKFIISSLSLPNNGDDFWLVKHWFTSTLYVWVNHSWLGWR